MAKGPPPEIFNREQLFKPFLVMGIVWFVKQYVDSENEDHIQMIRIAFGVQLFLCFIAHSVIGTLVRSARPQRSLLADHRFRICRLSASPTATRARWSAL